MNSPKPTLIALTFVAATLFALSAAGQDLFSQKDLDTLTELVDMLQVSDDMGTDLSIPVPMPQRQGFFHIVMSTGPLGIINWLGIFLWATATLPLAVLSIVHCSSTRSRQFPLATKLLICGAPCVFVLGCAGAAQATIGALGAMAMRSPDVGLLAVNVSQALYSIAGAFVICHVYLLFLAISLIIIHFKHKALEHQGS
jgi:hypothetical protein